MPLLRTARAADLVPIVDLQQSGSVLALADIFPQDEYPFPRDEITARWTAEMADPQIGVYVFGRDGATEGFAALRDNVLLHFGTAVETWGSGLAAAVHPEILARFRGPVARLKVFEGNARARRYYEKMGWSPTGGRTRTTFAPYPVLLEYELRLRADG